MENILQGLSHAVEYIDDILITGVSEEDRSTHEHQMASAQGYLVTTVGGEKSITLKDTIASECRFFE